MKQGYTVVASGWQGDVPPRDNRLGRALSRCNRAGRPAYNQAHHGRVPLHHARLLGRRRLRRGPTCGPYPAVPERVAEARLLRRTAPLPRARRYRTAIGRSQSVRTVRTRRQAMSTCATPPVFRRTTCTSSCTTRSDPLVMGIGFAATRDLVSFLRYERSTANPLSAKAAGQALRPAPLGDRVRPLAKRSLHQGSRLSGLQPRRGQARGVRRHHSAHFGIATDLHQRRVRDAGSPLNPLEAHFYSGDQFPHTYATVYDWMSKKRDGWLARCTNQGACPRSCTGIPALRRGAAGAIRWWLPMAQAGATCRCRKTCGCITLRARSMCPR